MKVAVLMGGKSSERKISLKTGKAVLNALLEKGYDAEPLDPAEDNFVQKIRNYDVAFVALHGRYGEDGTIQGLLEVLEVPYTGSGVLASALALNKIYSKLVFEKFGVPTAPFVFFNRHADDVPSSSPLGYPVVVKPASEGSSIGTSFVHNDNEFELALEKAFEYDDSVLIEKMLRGKELTVGIVGSGSSLKVLPVIEIVPSNEFFDFEAKYTPGKTEYLVPAPIDEKEAKLVQEVALKAHNSLGCFGVSRVDLIWDNEMGPQVLEVNTIPGMTETSLLPKAARAVGISFSDLVELILKTAFERTS